MTMSPRSPDTRSAQPTPPATTAPSSAYGRGEPHHRRHVDLTGRDRWRGACFGHRGPEHRWLRAVAGRLFFDARDPVDRTAGRGGNRLRLRARVLDGQAQRVPLHLTAVLEIESHAAER